VQPRAQPRCGIGRRPPPGKAVFAACPFLGKPELFYCVLFRCGPGSLGREKSFAPCFAVDFQLAASWVFSFVFWISQPLSRYQEARHSCRKAAESRGAAVVCLCAAGGSVLGTGRLGTSPARRQPLRSAGKAGCSQASGRSAVRDPSSAPAHGEGEPEPRDLLLRHGGVGEGCGQGCWRRPVRVGSALPRAELLWGRWCEPAGGLVGFRAEAPSFRQPGHRLCPRRCRAAAHLSKSHRLNSLCLPSQGNGQPTAAAGPRPPGARLPGARRAPWHALAPALRPGGRSSSSKARAGADLGYLFSTGSLVRRKVVQLKR